jgi:RNA polymerase sigma-70 factor (ECF subfamily)
VLSVALRLVKDPDAAEDVAQEALLLAHRHRASFRGESRYSTWLYRIATTCALMHLRRGRRLASIERADAESPPLERVDPAPGPFERCAAREALGHVDRRLETLGPRHREVFRMRFVDGHSDGEIAAALGVGLSTIKTRAHRTRRALGAAIADAPA